MPLVDFVSLTDLSKISFEDAVEALQIFIQNNWTGPIKPISPNLLSFDSSEVLSQLVLDGELPYRLVQDPILLLIALKFFSQPMPTSTEFLWWKQRTLFKHQRILDNPSETLLIAITSIVENEVDLQDVSNKFGPSIFTEIALIYQYYQDEKDAVKYLDMAAKEINFEYGLCGVLGKRTKFQTFDTSQLVVTSHPSSTTSAQVKSMEMPKDIQHNDDVILEKPIYTEEIPPKELSLNDLAILLANAEHLLTFHAKDELLVEKALAFMAKVLEKPNTWTIYTTALFYRSKLEAQKARLIERATLQIQALVDQINATEPPDRLDMFFATTMPSSWELDSAQGYLFASLGVFKTALSIFSRRELWDEAISCMVQVGDVKGAEDRIMVELERNPKNPKLLCILGDLREDPSYYEKAWEVSGKRFGRAQRALGNWHFKKQNWTNAINYFETSLGLNPLFTKTWFLLGCSYLQVDNLKKALYSFSRVISLDPDNSEAWNNIAAIYVRMDTPKDALNALKEASRLDYENWKTFDNYFHVALSCGELLLATQALRRQAEIRKEQFDLTSFNRLINMLSKAIQFVGIEEVEIQSVRVRIKDFNDQVLIHYFSSSFDYWSIMAKYYQLFGQFEDVKRCLFKAYRAAKSNLFHFNHLKLSKLLEVIEELFHVVLKNKDPNEMYQISLIAKETLLYIETHVGKQSIEYTNLDSLLLKVS